MARRGGEGPRGGASPLLHPTAEASGLRRIEQFRDARLVSEVARLCGDLPAEWPRDSLAAEPVVAPDSEAAQYLAALDAVAARLAIVLGARVSFAHMDDATGFALAVDVEEPTARLRAIVSRAFARADAVAWCMIEGERDDEALRAGADAIDRALAEIAPGFPDNHEAYLDKWQWRHPDGVLGRIERGLRARRFVTDTRRVQDDDEAETIAEACAALARRATLARKAAPLRQGRPSEVVARSWFVLRLATAHAFLTGERPAFHGDGIAAKRGTSWHAFVEAALDLTRVRGRDTTAGPEDRRASFRGTDAILRAAGESSEASRALLNAFLGNISAGGGSFDRRQDYMMLPGDDLENEAGVAEPPVRREDAYGALRTHYRGRTMEL